MGSGSNRVSNQELVETIGVQAHISIHSCFQRKKLAAGTVCDSKRLIGQELVRRGEGREG
ncbi:MAG: hypothetical protein ACI9R3_000126 [Verrucomicrobiales bacterium]|jgi:hypothetical protein